MFYVLTFGGYTPSFHRKRLFSGWRVIFAPRHFIERHTFSRMVIDFGLWNQDVCEQCCSEMYRFLFESRLEKTTFGRIFMNEKTGAIWQQEAAGNTNSEWLERFRMI